MQLVKIKSYWNGVVPESSLARVLCRGEVRDTDTGRTSCDHKGRGWRYIYEQGINASGCQQTTRSYTRDMEQGPIVLQQPLETEDLGIVLAKNN